MTTMKPDHPLRGLHDGADYMLENRIAGYAVEPVYSGGDLVTPKPVDFSAHAARGIRVIVRWNYSYARDSAGGQGTFPKRDRHDVFRKWLIASIRGSRGVFLNVIGNEPNRSAEWPAQDAPVTTADVLAVYNPVWKALPVEVRCAPPAIDPTNFESGDPLEYFKTMVAGLAGAEGFALHAYSYGSKQPVDTQDRFDPPLGYLPHGFRMFEPMAGALYPKWHETPLYITESSHLIRYDGKFGWDDDAGKWITDAYQYVADWNVGKGDQFIHALCLYRHHGDQWALTSHPGLLATWQGQGGIVMGWGVVSTTRTPGIDVSEYQGTIGWQKVLESGVRFAIIRASLGTSGKDHNVAHNWVQAQQAKLADGTQLALGTYHYFYVALDPVAQAHHFADVLGGKTYDGQIPPVLDLEDERHVPALDVLANNVHAFLTTLESLTGRHPMIYTGSWWWNQYMKPVPTWAASYPLWIAEYVALPEPALPHGFTTWSFWQHQIGKPGEVPGIAGECDLDVANGDLATVLKSLNP